MFGARILQVDGQSHASSRAGAIGRTRGSSNRDTPNISGAPRPERRRRDAQARSGRAHVVDEEDGAGRRCRRRRHEAGPAPALGPGAPRLRGSGEPPEQPGHGTVQATATARASSSAWSKPRRRRRGAVVGTQVTTVWRTSRPSAASAVAAASHGNAVGRRGTSAGPRAHGPRPRTRTRPPSRRHRTAAARRGADEGRRTPGTHRLTRVPASRTPCREQQRPECCAPPLHGVRVSGRGPPDDFPATAHPGSEAGGCDTDADRAGEPALTRAGNEGRCRRRQRRSGRRRARGTPRG